MTSLVTGATGFVGSNLVHALQQKGENVRAYVRPGRGDALSQNGCDVVEGEITDVERLRMAASGCDTVYHLAAKMVGADASRAEFRRTNVVGTRAVVSACRDLAVRLVHASTVGVYGMIKTAPVDENSPVSPTSTYRATKYQSEQVVRNAITQEGLSAVIVRLPAMIGPGSKLWLGLAGAIKAGNFRIVGDGTNHDHITFISDAVDGLILCGETPGIEGETFILASEEAVTVNQIVETIARKLHVMGAVGHLPRFPYKLYSRLNEIAFGAFGAELPGAYRHSLFLNEKVFDTHKARNLLHFRPQVSFEDGISRTLDWYRDEGLL